MTRPAAGFFALTCFGLALQAQVALAGPVAELAPPFPVAGKLSASLQKYSGLTWLAERGLGLSGTLAAKIMLGGSPSLKVKAYSLTDCFSGKFKKLDLSLKNCQYKKLPLADLKAETTTPLQIRLFRSKKGEPGVGVPVMLSLSGDLSEKDVSRALASPKVASELSFLRLQLPGLGDQHLQVLEPKVKIENGQVKIHSWLVTANAPKETGVTLDISASPELESDRFIVLKNCKIESADIVNPEEFAKFSQDLLNPLVDFARFDRKTHALRVQSLKLTEQNLHFAAKLLLVPKPVPKSDKTQVSENPAESQAKVGKSN